MRPRAQILAALGLLTALLAALPARPAVAGVALKTSWTIGTGVTLEKWRDAKVPVTAFVLDIDPSTAVTIDVGMPKASLPGSALTSAMGAQHGALGAINGDFGWGRPEHAVAQDGVLWQSGLQTAGNFAIAADESASYIARPRTVVTAYAPGGQFRIDLWNSGKPGSGEIAGYSPEGGSVENPPSSACSARLQLASSAFEWAAEKKGVKRTYTVQAVKCADTAMAENGGVVLSTPRASTNPARPWITGLTVGNTVTIKWSLGFPGVLDSIGGRPLLVQGGTNVAPTSCGLCGQNPRTAVGKTAAGHILFVVVDGRQGSTGWSKGMTLDGLAKFLLQLGAVDALNLDGGGSTTMWLSARGVYCQRNTTVGCIVNRANPDKNFQERPSESSLLVLPGADTYPGPEPVPSGP